jgi:DNA-binding beta-propeller fold protein YncE
VLQVLGRGLGGGVTEFNKPTDVAVHPSTSEVFVTDGYGNSRVVVFSYSGAFLREFGTFGKADGQFRVPHSITIDRAGDLYVADRENSRVQAFSPAGEHKATWLSRVATAGSRAPYMRHVSSIQYSEELDLFALSEGDGVVVRTPSGCDAAVVASQLNWPHDALLLPAATVARGLHNRSGLAANDAMVAYVAELQGMRLRKFVSSSKQIPDQPHDAYGRQLESANGVGLLVEAA